MQLKIWCHALGFIEQMLYLPRILVEGDFIELFKLWHDSWNTEPYRYNASMVTSIWTINSPHRALELVLMQNH